MTKDESHKELLDALRKNLDSACSIYSASRRSQLDDVRFYMGSPDNQYQWPSSVVQSRSGSFGGNNGLNARPCLTINKINPHVKLLANDIRRNKAGVKVVPEDDRGSVEVADILGDIIRGIEYDSDASIAYETASENQLVHGEGYIRIYTDYVDDNTFEQKIGISRIKNSFSVFMDPSIQQPCGKDARWCIVTELVPIDEYEALYPKYKVNDFSWNFGSQVPWFTNTHVRLAEYFYKDCTDETLLMYMTGDVVLKGSTDAKNLDELGVEVLKSRKIRCEKVKWFKTNGVDILEEGSWAGDRIPITRVVGNEYSCDGIIEISGHVRNSKDAQRMYNYWASQEAEMLALAPKAPFVGYVGQFEGLEDDWSNANNRNIPYLQANPVTDNSGSVLPLPQRSMPPMASSALLEAKRGASEDIKDVTGQYNASLGMTSNERSGRAIFARQGQSDLVNYHIPIIWLEPLKVLASSL